MVSDITDAKQLSGKRIVTSFPNLANEFFGKLDTPDKPTSKSQL